LSRFWDRGTGFINPEASASTGSDILNDGASYAFEVKGTSSSGHGNASMNGYFTLSPTGEKKLVITKCSIDYKFERSTGTRTYITGDMYKQE